jgi:cobalamin transport system substrate-binding protein
MRGMFGFNLRAGSATCVTTIVMLSLSVCGCHKKPSAAAHPAQMRIVCLSPAVTQMIIDLGKADKIVGLGRYDPTLDAATPPIKAEVVGDLFNLDYEKLLAVKPTDIFLQPAAATGVPDKLQEMAKQQHWRVHVYRLETIASVKGALFDGSGQGVGSALGVPDAAVDLRLKIENQLAAIAAHTLDSPAPKTLVLVSADPLTAVGPGTFLDELLNIAGGRNAIEDRGNLYPVLDKEKLVALNPDVIVIVRATTGDAPAQLPESLAGLDIAAVKDNRVLWLIDPQAMLPSSSMPRIGAELAGLLHPDVAEQIKRAVEHPDF